MDGLGKDDGGRQPVFSFFTGSARGLHRDDPQASSRGRNPYSAERTSMPTTPLDIPAGSSSSAPQQRRLVRSGGTDQYALRVNDEECLIRAILVESIDCLFAAVDELAESLQLDDPMNEPLLTPIDDQSMQFHGQLTALPRARRRQKLVASRAVFHTVSRR
jgi:hypothetical protein